MTAHDWISKRRDMEQSTTEGPWTTEEDWAYIAHGSDSVIHGYYDGKCPACGDEFTDDAFVALSIEDAEFMADARTSLPLALDALEKVLEMHHRRAWSVLSGDHMSFAQTEFPDQCDHCRRAYPCPTVTEIKSVLEVSDE